MSFDIPTYVINLDRATDRWAKMEPQLASLGLDYERIPGVDGKAEEVRLLANVDRLSFERNMGRKILIGGIGCYHSHLKAWDAFLETDSPVAMIFEDDVVFHDNFLEAIEFGLRAQDHWDLLKLNFIRAKLPIPQGKVGPYYLNAYLGPNTGTGGYLIKRELASKLRKAMIPITRATDHEINRFFKHDFRLRGLEPWPSHVDDGNVSLITGTGFADLKKFHPLVRLPNYWLRLSNYFRRGFWFLKRGELLGSKKPLPLRDIK